MMVKKKKLSRKQLNKQRREAIEQTRRRRGWRPTQSEAPFDQDLIEDLLPLLPDEEDPVAKQITMKALMMTVLDSDELAEEPELDDILIDPMESVNTFITVGEKLGIDPKTLNQLPVEEREEKQIEQFHQTAMRLLTKEVRREIDGALNNLRLRLKREGALKKVPKVAAIQSILREKKQTPDLGAGAGVVQAIVRRSIDAGFELMTSVAETLEEIQADEDETKTFAERLEQSSGVEKLEKLLAQSPAIKQSILRQVDEIREEGIKAIYNDDLDLALFTEAEKEAGLDILYKSFDLDKDSEANIAPQVTKDKIDIFLKNLDVYLTARFTPERLDSLRARLDELLKTENYPLHYTPFLTALQKSMAAEDAFEREKYTLLKICTGEILALTIRREAEKAVSDVERRT